MKIIPKIAKRFEGTFPADYKNTFPYFGFFSKQEIEEKSGKLLMLDIDFGRYCSLKCPSCFRKSNMVDDLSNSKDLGYDELLRVIDDARKLGLKCIKICGAGEPTQNRFFLRFLEDMSSRGIGVAVFTKGQVLGSDEETRKFYSAYGIKTASGLCRKLNELKVSILLSFISFNTRVQDSVVGGIKGHALLRNRALENLVSAGFNEGNPSRLALCSTPVTKANYNEIFDIYVYARERNIYPLIAPLMVSGKQINNKFITKNDISVKEKIDLYTRIYSYNIEHGIQTLQELEEEGISPMPGGHACNQIACGLYLTSKGIVVGCPGFTGKEGDVRKEGIAEIWRRSRNFRRRGTFNCKCPPKDGMTIPERLYKEVLESLTIK